MLVMVAIAVTAVVVYGVAIYNAFVRLRTAIDQAASNIDVLLKQRHDEIPNLVETTRAYASHEEAVLTRAITAARRFDEGRDASRGEDAAVAELFTVAEAHPTLKADAVFARLAERISALEERIADRREFYNHTVVAMNTRRDQVPDIVIARWFGFGPHATFDAPPDERGPIAVAAAT